MLARADIIALAHQLSSLRHDGSRVLTDQLVSVPLVYQDAMEVQSQLSKLEGVNASAWKVAKSSDGTPVAAPVHPYLDNPSDPIIAWRKGMKIEVEIAVKLRQDLPVRTDRAYDRDDVEAAISEAYLGAELVWSGISAVFPSSPFSRIALGTWAMSEGRRFRWQSLSLVRLSPFGFC